MEITLDMHSCLVRCPVESGCVGIDGSSRELSPLLSFVSGVSSQLTFSSLPCPGDSPGGSLKIFTCDEFPLY